MENAVERRLDWAGLPVIATVARLLCRELTLQNEYLRVLRKYSSGLLTGSKGLLRLPCS